LTVASSGVTHAQGTITYFRYEGGEAAAWKMRDDGSAQTQVTSPGSDADFHSNLGPSGTEIYFDRTPSSGTHIWSVKPNGGSLAQLTSGSGDNDEDPYAGSDGTVSYILVSACPSGHFPLLKVASVANAESIVAKPLGFELDHDGRREFMLSQWIAASVDWFDFYEAVADNTFQVVHEMDFTFPSISPEDVGDTDGDGLGELLADEAGCIPSADCYLRLYESASPGAYPTDAVWSENEPIMLDARVADTDADGEQEIVALARPLGEHLHILILESSGDNSFEQTLLIESGTGVAGPLMVSHDLDGDGRAEILHGGQLAKQSSYGVFAFEATANDAYAQIWFHPLAYQDGVVSVSRIADGGDMDGDGRAEFIVLGPWRPCRRGYVRL
jgi:hypothetical protein